MRSLLADTNGDGFIDAEELEAGFQMMGQMRRQSSIRRMITFADKDNNQKIDFDEFCDLMELAEASDTAAFDAVLVKKEQEPLSVDAAKEKRRVIRALGRPKLTKDELTASVYGKLSSLWEEEETPEMVAIKIRRFDEVIESLGKSSKKAYGLALEKIPERVDTDEYKLMFLRAELYDSKVRCVASEGVDFCL